MPDVADDLTGQSYVYSVVDEYILVQPRMNGDELCTVELPEGWGLSERTPDGMVGSGYFVVPIASEQEMLSRAEDAGLTLERDDNYFWEVFEPGE